MQIISTQRALLVFWDDLVFLEAAVLADERTAALAPAVTEHLEGFEAVFQGDLMSRRARLQSRARKKIADGGWITPSAHFTRRRLG